MTNCITATRPWGTNPSKEEPVSRIQVTPLAGISNCYLSSIMKGQRKPSGDGLGWLHAALSNPAPAERDMPVAPKCRVGRMTGRNGVLVKGAGGPHIGGKPGGRVPRVPR